MAEPAPVSLALAVAVVLAAVVAAKLTAWMREYALRAGIQDVPNERSSHTVPTPRGGGVSLVVVVATALGGALVWWPEEWRWLAASLVGVVAIASFGFLDDRSPLPARTRFLVQLACAAGVLFARGGQFDLELGFGLALSGWAANVFAVLYLVWMTNLFNFTVWPEFSPQFITTR